MRLSRRMGAVLGVAGIVLCLGSGIAWRVEHVLRRAEGSVSAEQNLGVTVEALAAQPNPGFTSISAPALFTSAAFFAGRMYLSGPGGLFVFSAQGDLLRVYRPGIDLPAVPLGQLTTGTLADSHGPELLIPTRGAGVVAFDGAHFRQIRPADTEARDVTALLPLASGRLLVGTARMGLLVFDGKSLRQFHNTTSNLYITALAGAESDLWVGTLDHGVVHWRGGQSTAISEPEGLPDRRVETIAQSDDAVYIGTPVGVAEVRDGRVARVLARGMYARALLAGPRELLVGQLQDGITKVGLEPGVNRTAFRRAISMPRDAGTKSGPDGAVEQIFREADSEYAVTGGQLLQRRFDGEWRQVLRSGDALLTNSDISSLLIASDGRIWVGYFDRGLDILPAGGGEPRHVEDDHVFCVNRMVEDPRQGTVAAATANGLVLFDRDGRQKQVLTRDSGLIASHVTDVALEDGGMVAATPAGITFLDATGLHSMYAFQGLVNNHVYALGVANRSLLVGTLGGLSLLSGDQVRRNFNTGNSGLKANWITALSPAGDDWIIGTYGAGLLRMSPDGTISATDATVAGTVINPGAIASDANIVLAGTLGKGLLVGDRSGTRWKTVQSGLPSENVTALAIHQGTVYIGTDNGLVKIAEDRL